MKAVDIVVVSYNSRGQLRGAVSEFAGDPAFNVIVVDNASTDGSLESVQDLPITRLAMPRNGGFAYGCNAGWRAGGARYVLFLNPDAALARPELKRLVLTLDERSDVGLVAPRIERADGGLEYSLRRFPRLRSTFAQALFLHRLFPDAEWAGEMVRNQEAYQRSAPAEWVSGACMLVRRTLLEEIQGFDEGFFLYCEDKDICRRAWREGYQIWYTASAVARHQGGASAPRASLLPVLAASRIRYARKHRGRLAATLERFGIALGELTHALVGRSGLRLGHAKAFALALGLRSTHLSG